MTIRTPFRLPSGAFTSTDQEVAEHLLETHFLGCQPISGPQSQSQPITPSIKWAVNGFGSYITAYDMEFFLAFYSKELKIWLWRCVKYSRLVWLSAMFLKLGKK
jgi:hypothetical protein